MKKLGDSMTSYMVGVLFSLVPDQRSSEIEKAHRWSRAKLGVSFSAGMVKAGSSVRSLGDKEADLTVENASLCQI